MAFVDFKDGCTGTSLSATPAAFTLLGGMYAFAVNATFGGGSVQVQQLQADGTTYIPVGAAITAEGTALYDLPPGTYEVVITTATAVVFSLIRVPVGRGA